MVEIYSRIIKISSEHSKFLANHSGIDEYRPFTPLNGRNAVPVIYFFFYPINWKLTSIFTRLRITCPTTEKCLHSYLMLPSNAIPMWLKSLSVNFHYFLSTQYTDFFFFFLSSPCCSTTFNSTDPSKSEILKYLTSKNLFANFPHGFPAERSILLK